MKRGDARAARQAEEALRGPALLAVVRGRMARNYGYVQGRALPAFQLAKRDCWLLEREILRMACSESATNQEDTDGEGEIESSR